MNKNIALLVLLLLSACTAQPHDTIKIGWLGPLTGGAAVYGEVGLNGAQLAVEDINAAGGINGKRIELVVEDGKCKGPEATSAVRKLIEVDKVKYIMGGHCSTESMSIVPITEANDVFIIAGTTGTADFSGKGQYAFRTFPSAKAMYGLLAEVAYEKGTRSVVTLSAETDWSQSVVDSFKERFAELGGNVLGEETYPFEAADFKTELVKLNNLGAESIMISVQTPAEAAQIIKQMLELNIDLQVYGDALVVSEATYENSQGGLSDTALGANAHVDTTNNPQAKEFVDRYLSLYERPGVDFFDVTEDYDGITIISQLIDECGDNTDCARELMLTRDWPGVSGTFRFNDQGDTIDPFVAIVRVVDGEMVFEN